MVVEMADIRTTTPIQTANVPSIRTPLIISSLIAGLGPAAELWSFFSMEHWLRIRFALLIALLSFVICVGIAVVAIVKHRWRGAWLLTPILLASVGPGLFVALWAACSQVGNCL